jgi:hypothetical protein
VEPGVHSDRAAVGADEEDHHPCRVRLCMPQVLCYGDHLTAFGDCPSVHTHQGSRRVAHCVGGGAVLPQ